MSSGSAILPTWIIPVFFRYPHYSGNYASIMDSNLTSIQPPNLKHGWLFLNLNFVFTYFLATAGYL